MNRAELGQLIRDGIELADIQEGRWRGSRETPQRKLAAVYDSERSRDASLGSDLRQTLWPVKDCASCERPE